MGHKSKCRIVKAVWFFASLSFLTLSKKIIKKEGKRKGEKGNLLFNENKKIVDELF